MAEGIKLEDVLKYTGIELGEDATEETFKTSFDAVFVKKDNAASDEGIKAAIMGESTRKYATEIKRTFKESGIELSEEEGKLPVNELLRLLPTKKDEIYTSKIEELESKAGKPTEAFDALQTKYSQLQTKFADVDGLREGLATKLTEKDKEFDTFQKTFKLTEATKDIWGKVTSNFSDTASDLEKRGFMASMNDTYTIELDGDKPVILKEGHRITDPNKHGEFLNPVDVIKQEAEAAKIWKVTDTTKVKPVSTVVATTNTSGVATGDKPQSRLVRHTN